MTMITCEG